MADEAPETPPPMTARCGESSPRWKEYTLDDFEHKGNLGVGSFGQVKRVVHKKTSEAFAMKVVPKAKVAEYKMADYLAREIQTQLQIRHPNILRLYHYLEDEGNVYFILEYAESGSLFGLQRKRGRLPEPEAAHIFASVVRAIDHLHSKGIVHRDLKPENILMCGSTAKIADFGWCTDGRASVARNTFCGTLDYLSPEMIKGEPHNFTVDIWACGVLLYEMLTGKPPFAAANQLKALVRITTVDLKIPPEVSASAGDLIFKLLVRDAAKRMRLALVLEHPWMLEHLPAPAQAPATASSVSSTVTVGSDAAVGEEKGAVGTAPGAHVGDAKVDTANGTSSPATPRKARDDEGARAAPAPHAPQASRTPAAAPGEVTGGEVPPAALVSDALKAPVAPAPAAAAPGDAAEVFPQSGGQVAALAPTDPMTAERPAMPRQPPALTPEACPAGGPGLDPRGEPRRFSSEDLEAPTRSPWTSPSHQTELGHSPKGGRHRATVDYTAPYCADGRDPGAPSKCQGEPGLSPGSRRHRAATDLAAACYADPRTDGVAIREHTRPAREPWTSSGPRDPERCACGRTFEPNTIFCTRCGTRRPLEPCAGGGGSGFEDGGVGGDAFLAPPFRHESGRDSERFCPSPRRALAQSSVASGHRDAPFSVGGAYASKYGLADRSPAHAGVHPGQGGLSGSYTHREPAMPMTAREPWGSRPADQDRGHHAPPMTAREPWGSKSSDLDRCRCGKLFKPGALFCTGCGHRRPAAHGGGCVDGLAHTVSTTEAHRTWRQTSEFEKIRKWCRQSSTVLAAELDEALPEDRPATLSHGNDAGTNTVEPSQPSNAYLAVRQWVRQVKGESAMDSSPRSPMPAELASTPRVASTCFPPSPSSRRSPGRAADAHGGFPSTPHAFPPSCLSPHPSEEWRPHRDRPGWELQDPPGARNYAGQEPVSTRGYTSQDLGIGGCSPRRQGSSAFAAGDFRGSDFRAGRAADGDMFYNPPARGGMDRSSPRKWDGGGGELPSSPTGLGIRPSISSSEATSNYGPSPRGGVVGSPGGKDAGRTADAASKGEPDGSTEADSASSKAEPEPAVSTSGSLLYGAVDTFQWGLMGTVGTLAKAMYEPVLEYMAEQEANEAAANGASPDGVAAPAEADGLRIL